MDLHKNILPVLGILLASFFLFCESISKTPNGYTFPVYMTEHCPRNETEFNERSSAINCTRSYSYACFPNEKLTLLLEFCYPNASISIQKDHCAFLSKGKPDLQDYNCKHFTYGCPDSPYEASTTFRYPSCVSLGYGCFIAEPSCENAITPFIKENSTYPIDEKDDENNIPIQQPDQTFSESVEKKEYIWLFTLLGVVIIVFAQLGILLFIKKRSSNQDRDADH
uniref:Uncharacterized protein LOC111133218 isoform X3 n=1 Tax=Crassostrea virginica TaxID=6565 RepID=A0A8B8EAC3_CRAVI|nr:uncharacterized protein LOC111133218 isoform X3 [Crassostrea virginica]